jgi:hypothetical protein
MRKGGRLFSQVRHGEAFIRSPFLRKGGFSSGLLLDEGGKLFIKSPLDECGKLF